jgi:hypothetical protein
VSAREIYDCLKARDFSVIVEYGVENGLFTDKAGCELALEEYLRYLAIDQTFAKETPISDAVDRFWHLHLLFTEDYMDMCYGVFGSFRHHRPQILGGPTREQDVGMIHYRSLFGEPNSAIWTAGMAGHGGRCGDGCSGT